MYQEKRMVLLIVYIMYGGLLKILYFINYLIILYKPIRQILYYPYINLLI